MAHLIGMLVRLRTGDRAGAGTDDAMYVGVVGRGGGREFPLDVRLFNDWERDSEVLYELGDVWEGAAVDDERVPWEAGPGDRNAPDAYRIELDDVDYVYLRKAGSRSRSGDDMYRFQSIEVDLYAREDDDPSKRTFSMDDAVWLGNEYGQQIWIPEVRA